jgi:hypothetical protein
MLRHTGVNPGSQGDRPALSRAALVRGRWAYAALFWAPLACGAVAILMVRGLLGFQFPVPWPDETGFVAPAFDFARSGSFFDPGLNPDRVVMWMPPGYMMLLAVVFRIFGYGYALARWVSAVACLMGLGLAGWLSWQLTAGWRRVVAGFAVAASFAAPAMLVDANVARMEMPFAALMLLALAASVASRQYLALAIVAAAAVIHFNAAYFLGPALLSFALPARGRRLPPLHAFDSAALALAVLILTLYGIYVARHWVGFRDDMAFQFSFERYLFQHDPAHAAWPALAGGTLAVVAIARGLAAARLTALWGLAFLIMAYNGHELWYDYGQPLGFALIAVAFLATPEGAGLFWISSTVVALILVPVMAARITPNLRALLPGRAMFSRSVVAPAEIGRVREFLATLKPGTTVDFGWTGMELFFLQDLARVGAHWTIVRHSVTQVWPLRSADWRVVCDSSEWPKMMLRFDIGHPRQGIDASCQIFPGTDRVVK